MVKNLLHTYGLNLFIAERLVKDLTPEQWTAQPHGLINHPCWSIGHLVKSANDLCVMLGVESSLPTGWEVIFKAGTPPDPNPSANPTKAEVMDAHRVLHAKLSEAVPGIDQATLDKEHPDEKTRTFFPTIGDMLVFMLSAHEMDHLGQIAAWRRAMALKP
ncbi:MAG: DinB family protein [Acidobacteriota bacterium]|nr:DinB family protein [Acidobacteriota bacterium]